VQLCGTVQGSGFADRQWLVQRDGGFFQLTELLYRVAEHLDGRRTLDEIAAGVSAATGRRMSADNVRQLIGTKLIPARLVAQAPGSAPGLAPGSEGALRSPLAVNLRLGVSPRLIGPIAWVLQVLYLPPVLIAVLLVAAAAHGWLYFAHGVAGGARELRDAPGLLLLLLPLTLASGLFHEFGHAAALCYGGGRARGLGIGLYLMLPVFYTDVTDVYRLGRWARIRTDLGGLYFNLIFGLGLLALYPFTGQEILLLAVVVINLEMLYQFLPFVRYDGYWLLADLTGIPDFFSMIGPFLRSVLPVSWWRGRRLPKLKRWVAAAFAVYILVTVPLLAFLLFLLVRRTPSILTATRDSVLWQAEAFAAARVAGDTTAMALSVVHLLTLTLYTFGLLFVLFNLGRRASGALWRWSRPTPARRAIGLLVVAGVVALVGYLWAPQLQVSPEQPDRRAPIDTPGPTPTPEPPRGASPEKSRADGYAPGEQPTANGGY
jgi:putative peptide zinc metalloprotease protein